MNEMQNQQSTARRSFGASVAKPAIEVLSADQAAMVGGGITASLTVKFNRGNGNPPDKDFDG